jgi:hypothetical protein
VRTSRTNRIGIVAATTITPAPTSVSATPNASAAGPASAAPTGMNTIEPSMS